MHSVEAVTSLAVDWVSVDAARRAAQAVGDYGCDECAEDEPAVAWCESCGALAARN